MTQHHRVLQRHAPKPWLILCVEAITTPTVRTFRQLLDEPDISLGRSLSWVLAASLGAAVLSWAIAPGFVHASPVTGDIAWSVGVDLAAVVALPAFLAGWAILHISAKALGGEANAGRMAFVMACYTAPLILLNGVIGGVENMAVSGAGAPVAPYGINLVSATYGVALGGLIARALITLASAWLGVTAVRAVHDLEGWRAAAPSLIYLALCFFGLVSALVPIPVS